MTEQEDEHTVPAQNAPPGRAKRRLGRYELLDRLGKGGMGVVYQARDTKLDRPVAVKMLLTDLEGDSETRERFLREARSAGELNHRNIIKIYDFGEDAGRAFLVMELLEGVSLNEFLKEHPHLSLNRKLEIMLGVCAGLAFSHSRSIIHRDLKPGNLFITKDDHVKVLDFGLARIASSDLTRSGLVFGTPDYMSPEQVRGRVVDERSDIFSLGAVFYQMLSGRKPFAAKALPEVMRKVLSDEPPPLHHTEAPLSLARIITRSLQKDPLNRYQKVGELLADLRKVDPDEPEDTDSRGEPRQIDRYQILDRIGQGGMGVVYRARDPVLDRDVAVKSMLLDFGVNQGTRAKFQHEARAAARLQHPNIVTIYEFGEKDDSHFLVMEFLEGDDLEELMGRDPPLSLERRLDILAQLCDGLAFAHAQGVVHRNIKPGNVRVLEDGSVKLLDFGIATVRKADDPSTDTFAGSVGHASPEQLSMARVDARSDLFSVGVIAYELLTGRRPFTGDSPPAIAYQVLNEEPAALRSITPQMPEALETVLTRALQKKPDQRWSSARELGEAFRAVAKTVEPAGSVPHPVRSRTTLGGQRSDRVGDLDLRGEPGGGKAGNELVDVPLRSAGPPAADTSRPRNWAVKGVVVVALVALFGLGSYYARRVLGGPPPASAQIEEVATAPEPAPPSGLEKPLDPAPVAIPTPVMLLVTSTPPGAAVSFDDVDTGEITPASIPLPLEEPYPQTVGLALAGYGPVSQEIPPVDGDVVELSFGELTRTLGRIGLADDYPFEVWVGGVQRRELGDSSDMRWDTGSVTLRIRNPEYFLDQSVTLEVVEDQRVELIVPALGSLTVFSNPGNCEIFLDDQSIDYPPITQRDIAAGPYAVSRRCADERENLEQRVTVVSDQDERVTFAPVQR